MGNTDGKFAEEIHVFEKTLELGDANGFQEAITKFPSSEKFTIPVPLWHKLILASLNLPYPQLCRCAEIMKNNYVLVEKKNEAFWLTFYVERGGKIQSSLYWSAEDTASRSIVTHKFDPQGAGAFVSRLLTLFRDPELRLIQETKHHLPGDRPGLIIQNLEMLARLIPLPSGQIPASFWQEKPTQDYVPPPPAAVAVPPPSATMAPGGYVTGLAYAVPPPTVPTPAPAPSTYVPSYPPVTTGPPSYPQPPPPYSPPETVSCGGTTAVAPPPAYAPPSTYAPPPAYAPSSNPPAYAPTTESTPVYAPSSNPPAYAPSSNPPAYAPTTVPSPPEPMAIAVEAPKKAPEPELPRTLECSICMDRPKNAVIKPCNHACFCYTCAIQSKDAKFSCPTCRGPIKGVEKIFL